VQCVRWFGLSLLFFCLFVTACARLPVQTGPAPERGRLLRMAEQALQQGQTFKAEEMYSELVHQEELSRNQRIQAWKGLARAAGANEHWQMTELALSQWAGMQPEVKKNWEWQSQLLEALWALDRGKWLAQASRVIQDPNMPWSVRIETAMHLCQQSVQAGRAGQAWKLINALHQQAASQEEKERLELNLWDRLRDMDTRDWEKIGKQPPQAETPVASLVGWVETQRALDRESLQWPQARSQLQDILARGRLALEDRLRQELQELEKEYGLPSQTVALACPMSGDYASMGWKIARGAAVAQWQLRLSGEDLNLEVINTAEKGWIKRIQALSGEYQLVGGPLARDKWEKVLATPGLRDLTFFPFRAELDPGREGKDGFRFFPGTEDQLQPLIDMLQTELGVREYAVLYPDSKYGRRLLGGFGQIVRRSSGRVSAQERYVPHQPGTWKKVVARLLRVDQKGRQNTQDRIPSPDFQAVFIPDSFSQAQILIPEFFYFDQDQLIFLGPTLWSQDLEEISELDRKYFQLALMASPWIPDMTTPAARKLRQGLEEMNEEEPDFWVALGYDFVRLAHRVGKMSTDGGSKDFTQILNSLHEFSWSMAPLSWDAQGRASQELFVVQPGDKGIRPVLVEEIKTYWDAVRRK
jgi:hypothetical protein